MCPSALKKYAMVKEKKLENNKASWFYHKHQQLSLLQHALDT